MDIRSLSIIDFHAVEDWLGEFIVWYVFNIRLHYSCSDDVSMRDSFYSYVDMVQIQITIKNKI